MFTVPRVKPIRVPGRVVRRTGGRGLVGTPKSDPRPIRGYNGPFHYCRVHVHIDRKPAVLGPPPATAPHSWDAGSEGGNVRRKSPSCPNFKDLRLDAQLMNREERFEQDPGFFHVFAGTLEPVNGGYHGDDLGAGLTQDLDGLKCLATGSRHIFK